MFFGEIRKRSGCNRKPDCQQFESALRKVLADKNISHSNYGNCTVIDNVTEYCPYSNVGTVSSHRLKKERFEDKVYTENEIQEVLNELRKTNLDRSDELLDLNDINIAYVASTVELDVLDDKNHKCLLCEKVFLENEKVHHSFTSQDHSRIACKSTYEICLLAEYFLKLDILKGQFSIGLIYQSIVKSLNIDSLYENTDFNTHGHEKLGLIKKILLRYIQYKGNALSKSITDIKKYQDQMRDRQKLSLAQKSP